MTQAKHMPRNPRRRILTLLQDLGRIRATAAKRWNQYQQINDGSGWRHLTEPEKRENSPTELLYLLRQCQIMREQITAIEHAAHFQLDWLRSQRETSSLPSQRSGAAS